MGCCQYLCGWFHWSWMLFNVCGLSHVCHNGMLSVFMWMVSLVVDAVQCVWVISCVPQWDVVSIYVDGFIGRGCCSMCVGYLMCATVGCCQYLCGWFHWSWMLFNVCGLSH